MMAVVRWDPTRELESFQTDMNRLFDGIFRSSEGNGVRRWIPATDLREDGDNLILRIDLPGMDEADVSVEINENVLTVTGERKSDYEEHSGQIYRSERAFGHFTRTFSLPDGVDEDAVKGHFDKGVLELSIPKPVAKQPKRVEISGSEDAPRTIEASPPG